MKKINMKSKKGFTIIELLVVIAVIGVLVLLAAPKFFGYTEKAKIANVKSDIVAYEKAIDTKRIDNDKYIEDWEKIDTPTMESMKKSMFNKKGLINDSNNATFEGEYYKIPKDNELVKTNLKGDFYLGQGGEVYYYDEKLASKVNSGTTPSKPENTTDKDLGYSDADFSWVKDPNGYIGKNGEKGYFQYTGTGRSTVEIPHVIQGVPVTSYYSMFKSSPAEITKVVSTNKNVTNMSYMFYYSKAENLDVSELDTSNVTDMSYMFYYSKTTSLDVSTFNTSKVEYMNNMFDNSEAKILDLRNFKTSNVTHMGRMFYSSKATTLNVSSFDTSKVKYMNEMFRFSKAISLDLSSFNTSNVIGMYAMFSWSQATTLDLSSFNTSNVTHMYEMFSGSKATSITFGPNFKTSNVTNMNQMFQTSEAKTLDLSTFDTSNVTNMSQMFYLSKATEGYARTQADADKFNASIDKPTGLTFKVKNP